MKRWGGGGGRHETDECEEERDGRKKKDGSIRDVKERKSLNGCWKRHCSQPIRASPLPSSLYPGSVIGRWEQSYRDGERESRIRKKKNSSAHHSISLSLSFGFSVVSVPCSPLSVLLLLARPWCFLIPEDIQWFNTMDLLPTDCCLQHGIMGAVVSSAVQCWSAGDCGSSEFRDVSWWADEANQALSLSIPSLFSF